MFLTLNAEWPQGKSSLVSGKESAALRIISALDFEFLSGDVFETAAPFILVSLFFEATALLPLVDRVCFFAEIAFVLLASTFDLEDEDAFDFEAAAAFDDRATVVFFELEVFKDLGVGTILTASPGCTLTEYHPPGISGQAANAPTTYSKHQSAMKIAKVLGIAPVFRAPISFLG